MNKKRLMEKYDQLNRKMRRHFDSYFADTALTSIQGFALHYIIVESEYKDVFPKDLEEFLQIKGSSVTSLINNLEKNGYLYRESISQDGRYKKLVLTEKTQKIKGEIAQKINDYIESMFVGIPVQDLEVFERVIVQMTKNIEK